MNVSVVIVCENHASFLAEAMESVLAQTHPDVELIVVDAGSTDRSTAVAAQVIAAHPDARIELLSQPASEQPAHARNRGIQVAHGEYLLCLDPYDGLPPDFIERCVVALEADPNAGFAYTDRQDLASEAYHQVRDYDFDALVNRNFLGAVALFRRSAWDAAGGFDASMPYDDWDFWIGCGASGHPGIKVEGTAWHNRTRTNGRRRGDELPEMRRTRAMLVRKRPDLYSPGQHAWAEVVLARKRLPDEAVRSFSTVAFADELIERPELLSAYASTFGPGDDASLLIFGEGVVELVTGMNLGGPAAPDIRPLAGVPSTVGAAANAEALLSMHPAGPALAELPRFGAEMMGGLRAAAERSWRRSDNGGVHQLHAEFISTGQLVIHVGAGTGDLTASFLELGATVVAVEPNAACAEQLRQRFEGRDDVTIIEKAVGSWEGSHESAWPQPMLVQMTTLARIIEIHGTPVFCMVEPEGFADHVLAGLDSPLPGAAFRCTPETLTEARLSAWRLAALGMTEFNYSIGDSGAWGSENWIGARSLYSAFNAHEADGFESAEVYARPRG